MVHLPGYTTRQNTPNIWHCFWRESIYRIMPKSLSSRLLLPEQGELYLPICFGGTHVQTLFIRKYSWRVKALLVFIHRNIKISCLAQTCPSGLGSNSIRCVAIICLEWWITLPFLPLQGASACFRPLPSSFQRTGKIWIHFCMEIVFGAPAFSPDMLTTTSKATKAPYTSEHSHTRNGTTPYP